MSLQTNVCSGAALRSVHTVWLGASPPEPAVGSAPLDVTGLEDVVGDYLEGRPIVASIRSRSRSRSSWGVVQLMWLYCRVSKWHFLI
jgi:hypothetical protein